ncbi:MAG TPA: T9SS type A sorting domain-containing protein, partial [Chitinophagaceae bacterium]|nr:T9SS type A sorting domain-containing protein [Chitinophagaceae bacterium]
DIVVVSTPSTSTNIIVQNSQMEVVVPDVAKFNVRAFPNPTEHQFSLVLENASNEKVQIVVYDALGRQVKMFEKDSGNIPIRFGADLKAGAYVVEVRQGDNRKSIKLVKQ